MDIIIENIRSLAGYHKVPLRPLTLLVGENSSGKTSFLAAVAALADPIGYPLTPRFNDPPFSLGSYDTIATFKGGKFGRAPYFKLGYATLDGKGNEIRGAGTYVSDRGRVVITSFNIESPTGRAELNFTLGESRRIATKAKVSQDGHAAEAEFEIPAALDEAAGLNLVFFIASALVQHPNFKQGQLDITKTLELFQPLPPISALSIAPIRTRPERTYSEVTEGYKPTGDHVPFVLERLLGETSTSRERRSLVAALERFGAESGLFKDVSIRRLGSKAGVPFQILVTVAGRAANLIDVGYGVSQALPIIVQSVLNPAERWLLLQQPEIHLHPRAQAALGTFFADLVENSKKSIIVETHSDFIIDRLRQEVAAKKLDADKVQILFFHKPRLETSVYAMTIDEEGNIVNAPSFYRDFLLREETKLLTRSVEGDVSHR
jgi:AAA ATPase-like protein